MLKLNRSFIICALILIMNSCTDDGPHLGTYYEKSYNDSLVSVFTNDSITIIIEQSRYAKQAEEIIPFNIMNDSTLSDTVKLILNVNFGSYAPDPDPYIDLSASADTFYVWYATRAKAFSKEFSKLSSVNNINGTETSPELEYYSIKNVLIKKSPDKTINFESKLY